MWRTKQVRTITGASLRQLQYWDETDVVHPSANRPASDGGSMRLYSFDDLLQLQVLVAMRVQGLSLQRIRRGLVYLRFRLSDIKQPLRELVLQTDGETMFAITGGEAIDTLDNGQHVCRVALGPIIEDLERRMIAGQPAEAVA